MAHIRYPDISDITQIVEIENECFDEPWTFSSFYVLVKRKGRILDMQGEITMLVMEHEKEIVGYIVCEFESRTKIGHILNLAVSKRCQRKGIGRILMHHVFHQLKKVNAVSCYLEVRESNMKAQKFYDSLGMVQTKRIPSYYGTEAALIYHRSF